MNKKIKILHLEDSQKDSELIHSIIRSGEIEFDYFFTDNEKDYLNILEIENIDLILSDFSLPDYNGNDALKVAREKYAHIPFIFVSGVMGEDAAISAMLNGAMDYVLKNNLARLVPAIKRGMSQSENEYKRKLAEKALRESQEMLQKARQLAHLGVWEWNADADIVTWTEELFQIAGLDPKFPAPTYAEHPTIYTPKSWQLLQTAVEKAMKTGEPYQLDLELIRPDGDIRNVVVFGGAKFNKEGSLSGLFGTVQDITQRKKTEEALRESEEKFRLLMEKIPLPLCYVKKDGAIIYRNERFVNVFGYTSEDVPTLTDWWLYAYPDAQYRQWVIQNWDSAVKKAAEKGEDIKSETYHVTSRDGIERDIIISGINIDEDFLATFFDITERKHSEQLLIDANKELAFQNEEKQKQSIELIQARKKAEESDNLKTAFLHNLSHEIRTPMNQILGFASFLNDPDLTDNTRSNYIGIINNQSQQLLHIISNIVEISEITTGQVYLNLGPINLEEMMVELMAKFTPDAARRNLQLILNKKLSAADSHIQGDIIKLKQIIDNLIENAIKFTDSGHIDIEYSKAGDRLIIAVKDTGIGIEAHKKQEIFNQFSQGKISKTRNYGGLGLGLSISKAYVNMMSGVIRVESKPGAGSTFIVQIPYIPAIRVPETAMKVVQQITGLQHDWKDKTLLIAEDEESNVQFLELVLRSTGIRLLYAVNGHEAVEQCKTHPEIDVVLMDIKMPRMDGLEATQIIKLFRSHLPVIATTAYAMALEREYILNAGCDDYLSKPIMKEDLIAKIQKYI